MLLITFIAQILLPLCLLAWLALAPAAGWLAWSLQVLAIAAALLGMTLAMLWAMPPYWTPYLYWMLLCFIVVWQLLGGLPDTSVLWAAGTVHSAALVLLFALGALGTFLGFSALKGRSWISPHPCPRAIISLPMVARRTLSTSTCKP